MPLVDVLRRQYPHLHFIESSAFYWSPREQAIYYVAKAAQAVAPWPLLHELGHAVLDHKNYHSDFELLLLEVAAWHKAEALALDFDLTIDPNHIQDCLDTYRDWLYQRSTCPTCGVVSLQHSPVLYQCHNCQSSWQVSQSRFCRPYRLRTSPEAAKAGTQLLTTFQ